MTTQLHIHLDQDLECHKVILSIMSAMVFVVVLLDRLNLTKVYILKTMEMK
jgi:hypothetical protein